MLDANLKQQLATYLEKVRVPVELVPALDDGAKSSELLALLNDIATLSDKVAVVRETVPADVRRPGFVIRRAAPAVAGGGLAEGAQTESGLAEGGQTESAQTESTQTADVAVTFAGIPLGHEFTSLVLALLQVGGHPPKVSDLTLDAVRALDGEFRFESYFSLSCQNCPDVVQALNLMSIINPGISHTAIDGGLFQDEITAREVMAVPSIFLNGKPFAQGRIEIEAIIAKLDTGAEQRNAAVLSQKDPFEVLVVGGGPAGAAAAIYAARKGIRTGIAAERFGGQLHDTLGIENFPSVQHTEGPRLAAQLETHVREYEVDIMNLARAERLVPATQDGGLHEVVLSNGASLHARTLILATGARWRQMGVPGEEQYRNKGVAYCPHCDGPLYKGKRVAVIGGGNSGVEAAIDLAGIVAHVTLIEYDSQLRADAVLQRKLASLGNVTVVTSALTTHVTGDGTRVTGLAYQDRTTGAAHDVALEGIFVQIGLVPNTEWLADTLALSKHREIEVDARGATSVPGIFAAGDATTTPFKQIIVATGEGSKAALSAFDHLIRLAPVEPVAVAA